MGCGTKCPSCGSSDYTIWPDSTCAKNETTPPSRIVLYEGHCRKCGRVEKYHMGPVLIGNRAELRFLPRGKKDMYGIGLPILASSISDAGQAGEE